MPRLGNNNDDTKHQWYVSSGRIFQFALLLMVSDSYGIKMPVLLLLLNRIASDPVSLAANSLTIMFADLGVNSSASMLLCINPEVSEPFVLAKEGADDSVKVEASQKISRTITSASIYAVLVAPFIVSGMIYSSWLLQNVFRQDETKADRAQAFLRLFSIAIPPTLFMIGAQQVSFSAKKVLVVLPNVILLGVSLLAAFGLGLGVMGLPALETPAILGAYIGESYLSAFLYAYYLKCNNKFAGLQFLSRAHLSADSLVHFLKTGSRPALTVFSEMLFGFGLTALASVFGTQKQAAVGISYNALWLNTFIAIKFSLASMVNLVRTKNQLSQLNNKADARLGLKQMALNAVVVTSLATIILPVLFAIFPQKMLSIYGKTDEAVMAHVEEIAPIFSVGFFLDALSYICLFQARALGDQNIPALLRSASFVLSAGLGALLSMPFQMNVRGLALGYALGMLFSSISLGVRCYHTVASVFSDENKTPVHSADQSMVAINMDQKLPKIDSVPPVLEPMQPSVENRSNDYCSTQRMFCLDMPLLADQQQSRMKESGLNMA